LARIEHVAFWVRDLDRFCAFYATHLGVVVGPLYENPAHGFASRFLTFHGGTRLEAMSTTTIEPVTHAPGAQRMGLTHIAIALGSEAQVDALTERLRRLGTPVVDGPRRTGDGYYESVILDPEGNRVELTA
jgi:lactoylglutathione lyase